jgi:hypothetical protein
MRMKTSFYLLLAGLAASLLMFSCGHDKDENEPVTLSGSLVSHSECKSSKSDSVFIIASDSISCVEYTYDSVQKKLTLIHVNAGFNCCPDSLYCKVSINMDTILIREFEKAVLCDCDCLYDLNIEVEGVESKSYVIQFIEPYCGEQEQLLFGTDFSIHKEGSYCVNRTKYPWGQE